MFWKILEKWRIRRWKKIWERIVIGRGRGWWFEGSNWFEENSCLVIVVRIEE